MARLTNRLTARTVETIIKPGLHADGGGLYLATKGGGRRWVFIFRWKGKRCEMGLGSVRDVSLAQAREIASSNRRLILTGTNPLTARNAERAALEQDDPGDARLLTFGTFAESYIASVEEGWKNQVHRQQWRNSLRDHANLLHGKLLSEVSTDDVLAVLRPIWMTKPETASRVRGRIEKILAAAKARGLRPRDAANPAQWRGHLDVLLPKRRRLTRGHHPAMPYPDMPAFMQQLALRPARAALALQFLILNASRTAEVLGAQWREIEGDTWTIPGERMKAGAPHTVTLTEPALYVLSLLDRGEPSDFIFSGRTSNDRLSSMSMAMLMRRMNSGHFTVHGFRSTFKDWAADCTDFSDEISEEALAHTVGSAVRRAYRRGAALDRRRKLMDAWSTYLSSAPAITDGKEEEA